MVDPEATILVAALANLVTGLVFALLARDRIRADGPFGGPVAVVWNDTYLEVEGHRRDVREGPVDVPVVGVARWAAGPPVPLLQPDRHRLQWRESELPSLRWPRPIVAVEVCASQPYVAWLDDAGEVVVYSMRHQALVLHLVPAEGAS